MLGPGKFRSSTSAIPSKSAVVEHNPTFTREPSELGFSKAGESTVLGPTLDCVKDVDPRTFDGVVSVSCAVIAS